MLPPSGRVHSVAEREVGVRAGERHGRRGTDFVWRSEAWETKDEIRGREEMGTMASVYIYMYASSSSVASKLCSLPFDRTSWPYRYVSVSAKIVATPRRYPRETSVFSVSKLKLNLPFE